MTDLKPDFKLKEVTHMNTRTNKSRTAKKTNPAVPISSQTITDKSQTEIPETVSPETVKNKGGRPPKDGTEPPKWTIRRVDLETRAIIEKAASKRSMTLGEFFNQEVREYCTGQIKKSKLPPASPTDVKDMINAEMATFKTDILAAMLQMQQQQKPETERKTLGQKLLDLFK